MDFSDTVQQGKQDPLRAGILLRLHLIQIEKGAPNRSSSTQTNRLSLKIVQISFLYGIYKMGNSAVIQVIATAKCNEEDEHTSCRHDFL